MITTEDQVITLSSKKHSGWELVQKIVWTAISQDKPGVSFDRFCIDLREYKDKNEVWIGWMYGIAVNLTLEFGDNQVRTYDRQRVSLEENAWSKKYKSLYVLLNAVEKELKQ